MQHSTWEVVVVVAAETTQLRGARQPLAAARVEKVHLVKVITLQQVRERTGQVVVVVVGVARLALAMVAGQQVVRVS